MKQTFLRTPGICGMDSFVARLADGCAVTLRLGVARDNLSFDLMASAVEGTPAQSFSLSSAGHLRPLRDVLNAALDAHDTKYGIATGEAPNFGTDHLERKLGEQTNRANQWKDMAEDREKRLDAAQGQVAKLQAENERLGRLVSEWQGLAVANDKAHTEMKATLAVTSRVASERLDKLASANQRIDLLEKNTGLPTVREEVLISANKRLLAELEAQKAATNSSAKDYDTLYRKVLSIRELSKV